MGHHFADDSDALRLRGFQDLAGEVKQARPLVADEALEEVGAAEIPAEAEVAKNSPEFCAVGGDADVAREREAKAGADSMPIDHRDRRTRRGGTRVASPALALP